MTCCSDKNAITIVRGNDTNFNGQVFLTLNLVTTVLDLSTFSASFALGGITKKFEDLSSGSIQINYNAKETQSLPFGLSYGVLKLFDNSGRVATIESKVPFCVIGQVSGNAIATQPYTLNFDVEQGGQTILNVSIEAGVTVQVGTTTTLPAGSDATVTNSGTANHIVLDFGIPEGEKGEQGEQGEQGPVGPDGKDGKDAKINGVNTLTLTATDGLALTQSGNVATLSGKAIQDSVTTESTNRSNADNNLQQQIDAIAASSDVTDIVGTHADLEAYDTRKLKDNDIIKVLQDETEGGATTYYRWSTHTHTFTLIGEEGPYYTKGDADAKFVPQTRTINNKELDENITLDASDVGAATAAQGAKADSAVQPNDLGSAAYEDKTAFATAAQGAKADTAVQPAAIANMATTNTAQDITATKTFKAQQRIQSGQADGCLVIGADVAATTLTNGTRKLGRMVFPTNEDTTLNCAFVSCDTQGTSQQQTIQNCAEFGGRPGDQTSTSPDVINFTVATEHNTTNNTKKKLALSIDKNSANFTVEPQYNGEPLVTTDTAQTITKKKTFQTTTWNGGLTAKRSGTGGSYIVFSNTNGDLGVIGIHQNELPLFIDKNNTEPRAVVRAGIYLSSSGNDASVGDTSTPVYIDSDGIAQECTGVETKTAVVALANSSTITLASNTIYNGGTLTALTIQLPAGVDNAFTSEIDFTSGATATTFTYPNTLKWIEGDDVNNQIFTPDVNKRYICMIIWDGTQYVGTVRGVE